MWKLVFGSAQGTSHIQSGQPCQDYCAAIARGSTLVAACADGAGSADLSQIGAKVAVDRFIEVASADVIPTLEQLENWVMTARQCLLEEAIANDTTPRQLACTFLGALIGDGWAAFIQIGDGMIVFDIPSGYGFAFWPDNGEYANTTCFLSEDDYQQNLRVEIVERSITELALMTDGLQMLALDIAGAKVHDRFFTPFFQTLKNDLDQETLKNSLLQFLDSKRVNERTDDDKTLLLATRITLDVSPQLSDETA